MIAEIIAQLLKERLKEPDLADCYVVEIKESPSKQFDVYLDSDAGINFEKCTKISRFLEQYLDNDERINGKYVLNVSSAGVGRPLQLKRQYKKNIGRTLKVKTTEGKVLEGELNAVDNEKIDLRIQKNKKEYMDQEILFNQIKEAIIKVRF